MASKMIGTEFFHGQGFGNQLFCYVTARCIALDNNCEFGTIGQKLFGAPRWNGNGAYFMEIYLGINADKNDFDNVYIEKSHRYYVDTCSHDMKRGCDISLFDGDLPRVKDSTLIGGNMQSEKYFIHRRKEIKEWLKVKPEYDSYELYKENLCIMNMRGGEYVRLKELFLERQYWLNSMENMRRINPEMRFMVITDDVKTAGRVLPEIPAYHFDLAKDYVSIKNAKYLILSNSSFAYFPVFTSETVEYIIAPKYWARFNVSNGYWATGQNIYNGWNYQDRDGKLYSSDECNNEFEDYKKRTGIYENRSKLSELLEELNLNITLNSCGTDKGKPKSYVGRFYESEFGGRQSANNRLLEVGVRSGASVALWANYFEKIEIIGVDIEAVGSPAGPLKEYLNYPSVRFFCGDAYTHELADSIEGFFSIMIDDGPHSLVSQNRFLELYLPKLNKDGVLVIEDIQRAYRDSAQLLKALPKGNKYVFETYDFRAISKTGDDFLFVVRHNTSGKSQMRNIAYIKLRSLFSWMAVPFRRIFRLLGRKLSKVV